MEEDWDCPLCMEEMDLSDKNFKPCPCGYQVCRFCWHRIREDGNERCPACRRIYTEEAVEFTPVPPEELNRMKQRKKAAKDKRDASAFDGSDAGAASSLDAAAIPSRKHLVDIRVIQRNLVYVIGISAKIANENVLKEPEYFGKYGKIVKIVVNKRNLVNCGSNQTPSASAYITYSRSSDAARAILGIDNFFFDGRVMRATYGTTKYCSYFLRGLSCQNPGCMYLHEQGEENDSYTKEQLTAGQRAQNFLASAANVDDADGRPPAAAATTTTTKTPTGKAEIAASTGSNIATSDTLPESSTKAATALTKEKSSTTANVTTADVMTAENRHDASFTTEETAAVPPVESVRNEIAITTTAAAATHTAPLDKPSSTSSSSSNTVLDEALERSTQSFFERCARFGLQPSPSLTADPVASAYHHSSSSSSASSLTDFMNPPAMPSGAGLAYTADDGSNGAALAACFPIHHNSSNNHLHSVRAGDACSSNNGNLDNRTSLSFQNMLMSPSLLLDGGNGGASNSFYHTPQAASFARDGSNSATGMAAMPLRHFGMALPPIPPLAPASSSYLASRPFSPFDNEAAMMTRAATSSATGGSDPASLADGGNAIIASNHAHVNNYTASSHHQNGLAMPSRQQPGPSGATAAGPFDFTNQHFYYQNQIDPFAATANNAGANRGEHPAMKGGEKANSSTLIDDAFAAHPMMSHRPSSYGPNAALAASSSALGGAGSAWGVSGTVSHGPLAQGMPLNAPNPTTAAFLEPQQQDPFAASLQQHHHHYPSMIPPHEAKTTPSAAAMDRLSASEQHFATPLSQSAAAKGRTGVMNNNNPAGGNGIMDNNSMSSLLLGPTSSFWNGGQLHGQPQLNGSAWQASSSGSFLQPIPAASDGGHIMGQQQHNSLATASLRTLLNIGTPSTLAASLPASSGPSQVPLPHAAPFAGQHHHLPQSTLQHASSSQPGVSVPLDQTGNASAAFHQRQQHHASGQQPGTALVDNTNQQGHFMPSDTKYPMTRNEDGRFVPSSASQPSLISISDLFGSSSGNVIDDIFSRKSRATATNAQASEPNQLAEELKMTKTPTSDAFNATIRENKPGCDNVAPGMVVPFGCSTAALAGSLESLMMLDSAVVASSKPATSNGQSKGLTATAAVAHAASSQPLPTFYGHNDQGSKSGSSAMMPQSVPIRFSEIAASVATPASPFNPSAGNAVVKGAPKQTTKPLTNVTAAGSVPLSFASTSSSSTNNNTFDSSSKGNAAAAPLRQSSPRKNASQLSDFISAVKISGGNGRGKEDSGTKMPAALPSAVTPSRANAYGEQPSGSASNKVSTKALPHHNQSILARSQSHRNNLFALLGNTDDDNYDDDDDDDDDDDENEEDAAAASKENERAENTGKDSNRNRMTTSTSTTLKGSAARTLEKEQNDTEGEHAAATGNGRQASTSSTSANVMSARAGNKTQQQQRAAMPTAESTPSKASSKNATVAIGSQAVPPTASVSNNVVEPLMMAGSVSASLPAHGRHHGTTTSAAAAERPARKSGGTDNDNIEGEEEGEEEVDQVDFANFESNIAVATRKTLAELKRASTPELVERLRELVKREANLFEDIRQLETIAMQSRHELKDLDQRLLAISQHNNKWIHELVHSSVPSGKGSSSAGGGAAAAAATAPPTGEGKTAAPKRSNNGAAAIAARSKMSN